MVITEQQPLLPPAAYLRDCPVSLGDGTVGGALQGLRATVECDRHDKAALRAWAAEHRPELGAESEKK